MLQLHRFFAHLIYQDHFKWNKKMIAKKYFKIFRRKLDFNHVSTLSAYIQHLKVDKNTENLWPLADKYTVRQHVTRLIGEEYLIKLLGVWEDPKEIDYDSLPNQYVLKTNHGSSWNIIVDNSQDINRKQTNKKLKKWLSTNFYNKTLEPQYRPIQPKILAEELLRDANGALLDYKFFCFFGQPYFIQVDVDRFTSERSRIYFNLNWEPLSFTINRPLCRSIIKRPENLDEMIDIAKILAEKHPFVRVDLYNVDRRTLFSELTFTPSKGYIKFLPNDTYDYIMGDFLAGRMKESLFRAAFNPALT